MVMIVRAGNRLVPCWARECRPMDSEAAIDIAPRDARPSSRYAPSPVAIVWLVDNCRAKRLLGALLEFFLRLTAADMEEWCDSPEQYYLLQDSLEARESVRVRPLSTRLTV